MRAVQAATAVELRTDLVTWVNVLVWRRERREMKRRIAAVIL